MNDLSFAGLREFAAQWLLLNRQRPYEPGTGHNEMWLSAGGRAGHSGLWGVTVEEGVYQPGAERSWDVTVSKSEEARAAAREAHQAAKDRNKEEKRLRKVQEAKTRILEAAAKEPDGDSKTRIRDRSGVHPREFETPFAELLHSGDLVPCDVFRGNRKQPIEGYKLGEGGIPSA